MPIHCSVCHSPALNYGAQLFCADQKGYFWPSGTKFPAYFPHCWQQAALVLLNFAALD